MTNVSEQAAERAVEKLRLIIDAAENSNQAGENAAVAAANGPQLLAALRQAAAALSVFCDEGAPEIVAAHGRAADAIAKAEGRL